MDVNGGALTLAIKIIFTVTVSVGMFLGWRVSKNNEEDLDITALNIMLGAMIGLIAGFVGIGLYFFYTATTFFPQR